NASRNNSLCSLCVAIEFSLASSDGLVAQERSLSQFGERFLQLLLRVHDDGSVPCHRFAERLAGNEQEANAILAGLYHNLIALIEEHERAILGKRGRRGIEP